MAGDNHRELQTGASERKAEKPEITLGQDELVRKPCHEGEAQVPESGRVGDGLANESEREGELPTSPSEKEDDAGSAWDGALAETGGSLEKALAAGRYSKIGTSDESEKSVDEPAGTQDMPYGDVEARLAKLKEQLAPLCQSKAEEMALWGYEQVEVDIIWELVAEEVRKSRALQLHQVANAILSLKPNHIMDHLMKALYRRK